MFLWQKKQKAFSRKLSVSSAKETYGLHGAKSNVGKVKLETMLASVLSHDQAKGGLKAFTGLCSFTARP